MLEFLAEVYYLLAEADMAGDAVGLGRGHLGLGEDDEGGPPRRRARGHEGVREVDVEVARHEGREGVGGAGERRRG